MASTGTPPEKEKLEIGGLSASPPQGGALGNSSSLTPGVPGGPPPPLVVNTGGTVSESRGTIRARKSNPLAKIDLEDGTHQRVQLNQSTTAKDVCDTILKRLVGEKPEDLKQYQGKFALYEIHKKKVTSLTTEKMIEPDTRLITIQEKWSKKKYKPQNCKFFFKSISGGTPVPRQKTSQLLESATPIQYIIKTLGDLTKDDLITSLPDVEEKLKEIVTMLRTKNLYQANFNKLKELENQVLDSVTKSLISSELAGQSSDTVTNTTSSASVASSRNPAIHGSVSVHSDPHYQGAEKLKAWGFNVFEYTDADLMQFIVSMFHQLDLLKTAKVHFPKLLAFIQEVKEHYNQNPYHNWHHAFDVCQTVYSQLTSMEGEKLLRKFDIFALMVAALCHDVGHPGMNNSFQINAVTPLAIEYNDRSVLENHHCRVTFEILSKKETNILDGLSQEEYRDFRRLVIQIILATDMAFHFEFITKFNSRLNTAQPFSPDNKDDRDLVCAMIMKSSDISNIAKPWQYSKHWSDLITEESFLQGDYEKSFGIETALFMDRTKSDEAINSIQFIDFVAGPLFESLAKLLPEAAVCCEHVKHNRNGWQNMKAARQRAEIPSDGTHTTTSHAPSDPNHKD